jgi:hypothetical protein
MLDPLEGWASRVFARENKESCRWRMEDGLAESGGREVADC